MGAGVFYFRRLWVQDENPRDRRRFIGARRYKLIACHVLWREFCHFAAQSKNIIDFDFLEQGLHNTPETLRTRLQAAIDDTDDNYEAILIGYGLCSNGIERLRARHCPLVFLRGHDCITFLLGSKERYREYFDEHPGTYWYSPGWIDDSVMPGKERYDVVMRAYIEQYGEENAEYLMKMEQQWYTHYSNVAFVDIDFDTDGRYKRFADDSAKWLGWKCDAIKGDARLFVDMLEGNWGAGDFLVVRPGEEVAPSFDEGIIEARRVAEEG